MSLEDIKQEVVKINCIADLMIGSAEENLQPVGILIKDITWPLMESIHSQIRDSRSD
jgi:hypothetical protein